MSEDSAETVTYNWSPQRYIDLVENTQFPMLREYQQAELKYLQSIQSVGTKTFVDVGAGYGRVVPRLAAISNGVVAVELDKNMLGELRKRAKMFANVTVVDGDGNDLARLLQGTDVQNPIVMSLQNSLGTWKGNYHEAIDQMREFAKSRKGEVIISLLCQEALENEGVPMYKSLKELVGEIDLDRTDFQKGVFRSKTDYKSKWWTPEERDEIASRLNGNKIAEIRNPSYYIVHTGYAA